MPCRFPFRATTVALFAVILGAVALSGQTARPLIGRAAPYNPDCAGEPACEAWIQFRTAHPYPYQSIQWSQLPNGRLAIMLFEPPPVMSKAELERLVRLAFGSDLQSYQRLRWRFGIDGWFDDAVLTVTLPYGLLAGDPLKDSRLRDRIAFLHVALFGTTYGATFDQQRNGLSTSPFNAAPNLQINPGEVRAWVTGPLTQWRPLLDPGATPATWQTLMAQHQIGAFASSDRTMVLLTFPGEILKKAPATPDAVDPVRVPFRCFAMATDAIAGAFQASNGQVAILGRPRTQPVASVPPLRFETFKLLASQTADELSQSYERRSLFAGKLLTGDYRDRDWAPIYLSDALIDTEFGTLLDTTDQLLKSWSEHGHVEYLYFNYAKPALFPFAARLSDKVYKDSGEQSVLFNWNTAGSAVTVNASLGRSLAVRQTGALPVTYGAGLEETQTNQLLLDEETAYRYFAGKKDANLARVVEYTLLYQFFRAVNSGTVPPPQLAIPRGQERAVRARREAAAIRVRAAIKLLADIQAGRIRLDPIEKRELDASLREFRAQNPALATDAKIAAIVADRFSDESKQLSEIERRKPLLEQLADNPIDDIREILTDAAHDSPDMELVRRGFVDSYRYEPAGWIKTPSMVISWNSNAELVGGHNLDARTLKIEASNTVHGLTLVETDDGPVLRYNPSQARQVEAHATELARAVEHRHVTDATELEGIIAPLVPTRPRFDALQLPRDGAASVTARLGETPYLGKSIFTDDLKLLSQTHACCEFLRYDGDGNAFATEHNPSPPPTIIVAELRDMSSVSDYLARASGRPSAERRAVVFLGANPDHVESLAMQVTLENGNARSLEEIAVVLGRRPIADSTPVDVVATHDLEGRVTLLKTPASEPGSAARRILERLGLRRPAASWVQAEVTPLTDTQASNLVRDIGWDEQTDGRPAAVMMTFNDGGAGVPPIDMSVVAGFGGDDFRPGQIAVHAINEKTLASARAKGATLAAYAATLKNEFKRLNPKRVQVIVREARKPYQFSKLEQKESDATKHAG